MGFQWPGPNIVPALTALGSGLGQRRHKNQVSDALAKLGPNASANDMADALISIGETEAGLKLKLMGMKEAKEPKWNYNKDTRSYFNENDPNQPPAPTGPAPVKLTPTDKNLLAKSEDALPALKGNLENLDKAIELNPKTMDGYFASSRASMGAKGPDWLPDQVFDPEQSRATNEWQLLMSPEAITQMSATLKGATTDRELATFVELLSDPSTPKQTRLGVLKRMKALTQRKLELQQGRAQEIRAGGMGSAVEAGGGDMDFGEPQEGDEIEGPDGKAYIWQNGQLVPR